MASPLSLFTLMLFLFRCFVLIEFMITLDPHAMSWQAG